MLQYCNVIQMVHGCIRRVRVQGHKKLFYDDLPLRVLFDGMPWLDRKMTYIWHWKLK
jgi:hypothetical protein